MRTRLLGSNLIVLVLVLLSACGGGGSDETGNLAPVAHAGAAQNVTSGASVELNGNSSSDVDGSIASFRWTQVSGSAVTITNANSAQASFVAPQVTQVVTLIFSLVVTDNGGASSTAATVNITVSPPVSSTASVTLTGFVRFARVPFTTQGSIGLDYANPVMRPARGVIVQVLDATSQNLITSGVTGADGAYSLAVAENTSVTLRVLARMHRGSDQPLPRWDMRVQDGQGSLAPYAYTTPPFTTGSTARDVEIPLGITPTGTPSGTRASGPFAILDSIYTAMQAVLAVAPETSFPALYVNWGDLADGTYFTTVEGQHITALNDLTEDTDEFDQHIIAHEFGHYLEHNFSRSDSLGGSHGLGDRLDMRVAFGEGFGYAFAAIALADPLVLDSFVDNGMHRAGGFNVEVNVPVGAGDGCWCSESSVWSILWDLYDSAADANDAVALGFGPIWSVLTGPQRTTPAFTSIFSFIPALKAAQPAQAAAIDTIVAAHNIKATGMDAFALGETNAPYPGMLPLYADAAPGAPVVVRSLDDGGRYNKAGNRRYVRFVPDSSRQVTVRVSTSNATASADPDFAVFSNGLLVTLAQGPPAITEISRPFNVTAGQTYLIDVYECGNGCSLDEGITGDYDLTVSIE